MKTRLWIALLITAWTLTVSAADPLTELLQKGLFEEEANHDLQAAIQSYQSVVAQADQQRKLAATAVFRLGECYRKLGRTNEAAIQYQRVLRDFADQTNLVTLSRQNFDPKTPPLADRETGSGARDYLFERELTTQEMELARLIAQFEQMAGRPREELKRTALALTSDQLLTGLVETQFRTEQQLNSLKSKYGPEHPEVKEVVAVLDKVNQQIEQRLDGILLGLKTKIGVLQVGIEELRKKLELARTSIPISAVATVNASAETGATDDEDKEIRRIQALIQSSPDLIDKPGTNNLTPLQQAAQAGYLAVARFLLDHKASVNATSTVDLRGRRGAKDATALHIAAFHGNKAMVELLLDRGADINAVGTWQGTTGSALHIAAKHGYQAVAEALLARKTDVNLSPDGGVTPLAVAAAAGNSALVKLLIEHGADVNATNLDGGTPMHGAAQTGSLAVAELLLAHQAAVEAKTKNGDTPLTVAVDFGQIKVAEFLLKNGAKVEAKAGNELTPLQNAIIGPNSAGRGGQPELVRLLLKMGADPNRPFNAAGSARWCRPNQSGGGLDSTGSTPLAIAAYFGDVAVVGALLEGGAEVNAKSNEGLNPLHYAVDQKSIPMLDAILARKPDLEVRNPNGYTALALAILAGEKRIAEKLIQAGANVNAEVPESPMGTRSLLHLAVLRENKDLVELLLTHQAKVNVININGATPLDVASGLSRDARSQNREADAEIAALLLKFGADKDYTRRSYIAVTRQNRNLYSRVFTRGTNDWNRYTLLELIANAFDGRLNDPAKSLAFPDLSRVKINRLGPKGEPDHSFTVDVEMMINTVDNTNVTWLEWGDLVDFQELDHPVNAGWNGLAPAMCEALKKALRREVTIAIKGQNRQVVLTPSFTGPTPPLPPVQSPISPATNTGPISLEVFRLRQVLNGSGLLRVSSDLSRVRVTRTDSLTRKPVEWTVDLSSDKAYDPRTDLWLRDGDVIEVPEK